MVELAASYPALERANVYTAAVTGRADRVDELVSYDPALALALDERRHWPPLLYACYSHWARIDPGCAAGIVAVAERLIAAGASPDTHNGQLPNRGYRSALHGAVSQNNQAL